MRPPRAHALTATLIAAACALVALAPSAQARSLWSYTKRGAFSFASAPGLHPPKLLIVSKAKNSQLARGAYMIAPGPDLSVHSPMVGQSGPEIFDRHGQPIWFTHVPRSVIANDLTVQRYNGKPALSYWQGVETAKGLVTSGEDVVLDQHYKKIATLRGADGWIVDLHEMVISGTNAWVIAAKNVPMDFSAEGGPAHGTLVDTAVQEYDLRTGHLLFTWDPKDHISLTDSFSHPDKSGVWDAYHGNSLQLTGNGTFLFSMRNTWAAYEINAGTGVVNWTLGGKHSTFNIASKGRFQWQHDVQLHKNNVVSIFDDHCCGVTNSGSFIKPTGPTRGLVLQLDTTHKTASLVEQYLRDKNFHAAFLGDTDLQPNGNVVIGWGSQSLFSEYTRKGKKLLDGELPSPDQTYRTIKESWTGTPGYLPGGAVRSKHGKTTVYASWNGDTQVAKWRVLAGNSKKHLKTVASAGKNGFETAIRLSRSAKVYEVVALDRKGHRLSTSKPF